MSEICKQEGPIGEIRATLLFFQNAEERREQREERMLKAMEEIAAHGATITNLTQRTTKIEKDLTEAFGEIRCKASSVLVHSIDKRVLEIEMKHMRESGIKKAETRSAARWAAFKKRGMPYAISIALFVVYLIDRFGVATKVAKLWQEFKG